MNFNLERFRRNLHNYIALYVYCSNILFHLTELMSNKLTLETNYGLLKVIGWVCIVYNDENCRVTN